MASIRKRGNRINVQIRKKGYPLVSKSFLSLTVARKWAVRRQNLVDLKLPELRETLAHQVVLMLITVMHLLAERQGL